MVTSPTVCDLGRWRAHNHRRAGYLRMLAAILLACGCTDDSAIDETGGMCAVDPAVVMTGELIQWGPFGHDFGEFCSAGFDSAEDHARWVAQAWGIEPAPFDYGLFESRDEPCWPCADQFDACVVGGIVAATAVPHRHEIAHAVRPGTCFSLIEEGWAMLYGDHYEGAETIGDIQLALADSNPGLPGMYYPLAARFVAFLIETHGMPKLRELCDLGAHDPSEFEAAVLATYDTTFDDLADAFESYPEWGLGQLRQDRACESDDVLVGPASWDFEFDCGAPAIEGKVGVAFETQRLIEIPQEGIYQFTFESPTELELRVEIRSCAREGMASSYYYGPYVNVQAGIPKIRPMLDPYPAGVYVFRVRVVEPIEPVGLHMSVATWP